MATEELLKLIAIVDDDELIRNALDGLLKAAGFPALAFASAEDFLNSGQQEHAACVIADIRMPGMSGLDLQSKLNEGHYRIPIIFITAQGDEKMRLQALRAGAVEFLTKPFDDEVLLDSVRAALDR
jgi:FixJ family two-component response regulator